MSKFVPSLPDTPPPENMPLVFAATVMSKSLAFGFRHEGFFNSEIKGTDAEMILLCNRKKTMALQRDITVFSFPDPASGRTLYHCIGGKVKGREIKPSPNYGAFISEEVKKQLSQSAGFVDLPYKERQCVSTESVPLRTAQTALKAKNAEDLMRAGLQILTFREGRKDLQDYDFSDEAVREKGHATLNRYLGDLVKQKIIVWENNERGINPHPAFGEQLGVALKTPPLRIEAKKAGALKL